MPAAVFVKCPNSPTMEESCFNSILDFPSEASLLAPQPMDLHSAPVPPFLIKTYDMVTDPASDDTVSWSFSSNSFVVWKPLEFGRDVLPKYFKHNNFSSFVRQLNFYGFRKVDPDRWEFANEGFLRGQKHLLKSIHRRKSTFHLQQARTFGGLEDEVEALKTDNKVLMLEMVRIREQQQAAQAEMQRMGQRMCIAEQRQQQMMSFLAKAMRNPTFFAQILQQSQAVKGLPSSAKKRCLTRQETDIIGNPGEIDVVILSDNQDLGGTVEDSDAGEIDAFQGWPEDYDVKFIEALNGF